MDGCWQVLYDDPHDEFVPVDGTWTDVSLRRSGFSVYAGGQFVQLRVESGRPLPTSWPPSAAERIRYFRTATSAAGPCSWRAAESGWTGTHTVTTSPDPRDHGSSFEYVATPGPDGHIEVVGERADGTRVHESWRRLSGPGTSPLAGAWESTGAEERWLLLVTEGHYGVTREHLHRAMLPPTGELGEEEILSICDTQSCNVGAIVVTTTSFDNHPFASTSLPGYDAAKHPSFRLVSVEPDRLMIGFRDDGSDAAPWTRLG
jgi:hypothetical protein